MYWVFSQTLWPCLALVAGPLGVLTGLIEAAIGHVAMRSRFANRLGGYTGDTLGAVQQMSEIGFYLGLIAWL